MAIRFVPIDRDTPLLLPPNLRDWVPDDHLVHFILDAVAALDLRRVKVNERGTGSEQYPPTMMLALLIYSYATGTFGSRASSRALTTVCRCACSPPTRIPITTRSAPSAARTRRCWVTVSSRVGRGECRFLKSIAENFRSLASRHRHCHAPFVLCVKPDRLLAEIRA